MPIPVEQLGKDWWADGDTPVQRDSRVTFFVDGHMTMLSLCRHFLKAQHYIYLANWGIKAEIELVRGSDHRAGPDGSPEQEKLLAELRADGLQEADITFWCTQTLSLKNVLGYAASKGVEVKVLIWDNPNVFTRTFPKEAQKQLTPVGVNCLLDDSALVLQHPAESLHQKISIVDGAYAFVGGVDPLIEAEERCLSVETWPPWECFLRSEKDSSASMDNMSINLFRGWKHTSIFWMNSGD